MKDGFWLVVGLNNLKAFLKGKTWWNGLNFVVCYKCQVLNAMGLAAADKIVYK